MPQIVSLPIPNSWYAVGFSHELTSGKLLSRTIAGQDIIVFRVKSGQVCAMDAYCPHLGAHMGTGGKVVGETVSCPFHDFRFDTSGTCVATGYGTKPPPTARIKTWVVCEVNGIVFVYYDSRNQPPTWQIPKLDTAGWTTPVFKVFDIHDHPQETVENGVDIGHFGVIHGYSEVALRKELLVDGPHFYISYCARRPMPYLQAFGVMVDFEFDLSIHGLGFSLVNVSVPKLGVVARLFVMARPTVKERIDLTLALSLRKIEDRSKVHPLAQLIPHTILNNVIAYTIHRGLINDARQDFVIWENKRYLHPPALAEGDGPIGKYRTWARQFYYEKTLQEEPSFEL
ncbi:MAG TPA: Rieske 2Fe-2S domain-containing protein [Chloroflexia bacterium]|nr:Rieske 2Fe-2S domain-containing protein [Chloroflexia bacterium]